jgi:hypothetical protein
MKRILLGTGALVLVALGALAVHSFLGENEVRRELEALRGELRSARSQADSCRVALTWEEQDFLGFDAYVDSLHGQVRGFEDPDQGGVPGVEYEEYLASFDRYNDSVAVWQNRVDSLRATEASCRALAEAHNALGDSLRQRLSEVGGAVK